MGYFHLSKFLQNVTFLPLKKILLVKSLWPNNQLIFPMTLFPVDFLHERQSYQTKTGKEWQYPNFLLSVM